MKAEGCAFSLMRLAKDHAVRFPKLMTCLNIGCPLGNGIWEGDLPEGRIPTPTYGFDPKTGRPKSWPIRRSRAHCAAPLPGLPPGQYTLRCRTIDAKGAAQPLPRPFRKSGRAAIEQIPITVKG